MAYKGLDKNSIFNKKTVMDLSVFNDNNCLDNASNNIVDLQELRQTLCNNGYSIENITSAFILAMKQYFFEHFTARNLFFNSLCKFFKMFLSCGDNGCLNSVIFSNSPNVLEPK